MVLYNIHLKNFTMRKLLLILTFNLFCCIIINSQQTIKFSKKSIIISSEVAKQAREFYSNIVPGNELVVSVLTKKEQKKFTNKEKINFSRVRVKKLATYYKDTLGVNTNNLLIQYNPFEDKRQKGNGHPLTGVTWTRDNFKKISNRNGVYQLVIIRAEKLVASGYINDTINGVIRTSFNKKYGTYLYGEYTRVYIPANSYDCDCEEIELELKEFFTPSEILLAGLTTTSGGKTLMTGGMIHIMSYCNGKEVPLKMGTKAEINFRTITKTYGIFYGKEKNGIIDWKRDNNIKTKLNPIEFDDEMEEQTGGLKIITDKFGWINCDAFVKDGPKTELLVDLEDPADDSTYFRLIFHDIKSVLPGYFTNDNKSKVVFKNIPEGKKTSLLIYNIINKTHIQWAIVNVETGKDKIISAFKYKKTTYDEFKKSTDEIW